MYSTMRYRPRRSAVSIWAQKHHRFTTQHRAHRLGSASSCLDNRKWFRACCSTCSYGPHRGKLLSYSSLPAIKGYACRRLLTRSVLLPSTAVAGGWSAEDSGCAAPGTWAVRASPRATTGSVQLGGGCPGRAPTSSVCVDIESAGEELSMHESP